MWSPSRKAFLSTAIAWLLVGCGGNAVAVLHGIGKPGGDGPAMLTLENVSGATIQRLHVAETAEVDKAAAAGVNPGSEDDLSLWGDDLLGNRGVGNARTFPDLRFKEGRYDFLLVDHARREQLVKGLLLRSGGKYRLEVKDNWGSGR